MDKKYSFCGKQSLLALAVASSLTFTPFQAEAAGLGKITVFSGLGQPLRAEVQVSATADEAMGMSAKLAPIDYFRQSGVEFAPALLGLQFSTEKRPSGMVIKISSEKPINDPFLDFLVELNWPSGRLVREYTFLLDPVDIMPQTPRKAVVEAREVPALKSLEIENKKSQQAEVPATQPAPVAMAEPVATKKPPQKETKATPVPERAPAAPAKTETTGEHAEHVVKPGDTLHRIASSNLPEGVSLEQMLVSLYRNNASAFSNNNMNRLRAGAVLRVPTQEEAAAITPQEARKVFRAQSNDWKTYRNNLATAAQAVPTASDSNNGRVASGSVSTTVDEKAPQPEKTKDKVKISPTIQSKGNSGISEDDLIAKQKALDEEKTRVQELEGIVAKQEALLKVQNEKLANFEAHVNTSAKPPVPETKPQTTAPVAEVPTTPSSVAPPVSPESPSTAASEAIAPPPENAENQPPVSPEGTPNAENAEGNTTTEAQEPPKPPPPKIVPQPVVEPEPIPEPSFLESIGLLPIIGGLAAIAGGIGLLLYRRRRNSAAAEDNLDSAAPNSGAITSSSSLGPNSVFQTAGGQSVDTNQAAIPLNTEFSISGNGSIDTHEVDPVSEADVYMAYGRDTQAEEILLDALQKDPQRIAIHSKLLEIYAMRKSVKQFETLASELYSLTAGQGADWEKVVAMGKELDPTNPMYTVKQGTTAAPAPSSSSLEDSFSFISSPAATSKPVTAAATQEPESELSTFDIGSVATSVETTPQTMEFSYGSTNTSNDRQEKNGLSETLVNSTLEATEPLDFDLGTNTKVSDRSSISEDLMVTGLNLDDLPESSLQATTLVSHNQGFVDNSPPPSLTLTTSDLSFPAIVKDAPSTPSTHLDPDEEMEFDMKLTASTVLGNAMPSDFDLSSIDLDLGGTEPSLSTTAIGPDSGIQSDDVSTKLDLAKAYEDMGDAEGAIELLKEVANEGTPEQIEAARANLARLGA